MELIVVVLIVGILAAVVSRSTGLRPRLAAGEGKALAGAALTAAQACAQNDPTGATCTLATLAPRIA